MSCVFVGLCNDSINQTKRDMPPPTPADLQGFWEMVYLQVENVDSLFAELDTIRANGWKVSGKACGSHVIFQCELHSKYYISIFQLFGIVVAAFITLFFLPRCCNKIETDTGKTKATARSKISKTANNGIISNSCSSASIWNNEEIG